MSQWAKQRENNQAKAVWDKEYNRLCTEAKRK